MVYLKSSEMRKSINSLVGILTGITADGILQDEEKAELTNWYLLHRSMIYQYPFSTIVPQINIALSEDYLSLKSAEDMIWLCQHSIDANREQFNFVDKTSTIQQLHGILHGVLADGRILNEEINALQAWITEHDDLVDAFPLCEIKDSIARVLEDGVVTEEERDILKAFFASFVDLRKSYNISETEIIELQKKYNISAICEINPQISFSGKYFYLSGDFDRMINTKVIEMLESKGGKNEKGVNKRTDYLVIGAKGDPGWSFETYGAKVEQAIKNKKQGYKIRIISEADFWAAYERCGDEEEPTDSLLGNDVQTILDSLRPQINETLQKLNFSEKHVVFGDLKAGKKSIRLNIQPSKLTASAVTENDSAGQAVLLRIIPMAKSTRIEIPADRAMFYEDSFAIRAKKGACADFNFMMDDCEKLAVAFCTDLKNRLLTYPSDFACCARYEECSEKGECVQPDQDMSAGCYYKRNLYRGNNFLKKTE